MGKKITRRSFIKQGAALSASSLLLHPLSENLYSGEIHGSPDISVVTGADYHKSTVEAVSRLGGMKKFVGKGIFWQ